MKRNYFEVPGKFNLKEISTTYETGMDTVDKYNQNNINPISLWQRNPFSS